jgi:radical SAM protein with 4Fe4S-binding SPASM domain
MRTFNLEITTMIGCPLLCTYCPQDALKDAYGKEDVKYLSLEDFKTVVDKLDPTVLRLDFSGQAEPWVNPACTDMLEYALTQGFHVSIFTTLYNWKEDDVHRVGQLLLDHAEQVDIVKIHFPDAAGNMRGWRPSEEWNYAFAGIQTIVQAAGIHYEAMTMSDHGVHPAIRNLPGVGVSHGWGIVAHDRAGTLDHEQVKEQPMALQPKHKRPVVCGKNPRFNQGVLLPNGEVLLCCMDYEKKHVVGNLLTQTYDEVWRSDAVKRIYQLNALDTWTDQTLCKSCTDAKVL